jgi:hypothetical protein
LALFSFALAEASSTQEPMMSGPDSSEQSSVIVPCPNCGRKLRFPRLPNVLNVTCTACRHKFELPPSVEVTARARPRAARKSDWKYAYGFGAFVLVCFCAGLLRNSKSTTPAGASGAAPVASQEQVRSQLKSEISNILNANRQQVFQAFHPVGTAQRIEVHEVNATQSAAGPALLDFRYTIYWRGPVTTDGFTKVSQTYDFESQRCVNTQILATNGITKAEATESAVAFATGFLQEMARQELQRQFSQ